MKLLIRGPDRSMAACIFDGAPSRGALPEG
jgi:hypothetical protein